MRWGGQSCGTPRGVKRLGFWQCQATSGFLCRRACSTPRRLCCRMRAEPHSSVALQHARA